MNKKMNIERKLFDTTCKQSAFRFPLSTKLAKIEAEEINGTDEFVIEFPLEDDADDNDDVGAFCRFFFKEQKFFF